MELYYLSPWMIQPFSNDSGLLCTSYTIYSHHKTKSCDNIHYENSAFSDICHATCPSSLRLSFVGFSFSTRPTEGRLSFVGFSFSTRPTEGRLSFVGFSFSTRPTEGRHRCLFLDCNSISWPRFKASLPWLLLLWLNQFRFFNRTHSRFCYNNNNNNNNASVTPFIAADNSVFTRFQAGILAFFYFNEENDIRSLFFSKCSSF